ncbi:hypothetical protein BN7_5668 [Wickerhamomyces ciferrii]|uniref:DUF4484 domain-containing protein n=1 Tax=Wickerhamomyces ciferrii (strain ATCC 14091 / BCRC 22168 / CBS 111 / JCM 3599 / NBRC 0793 / NRRL Y-1031 F-60-10) TaxID=1206466 RepID=K0KLE3_WICCF|nr:uncharacterized protein BN7_5668 [Wickerhamomyces ciferrii]CCH46080.1 hypothetical protein BN7_5668 [Wickerhamomyces ciferrii]
MSNPSTPQTQKSKPVVRQSPKPLSTPESSSKGLNILLQNAVANSRPPSPISAVFLVQFDVKSGYVLKWSKTVDKNLSLKGVEFKSLPSGLHEVERDVISFVQIKDNDSTSVNGDSTTDTSDSNPFDNLLYGVSVFHQNLGEAFGNQRNKVKMFSLGILVDPLGQIQSNSGVSKFTGDLPAWRPMYYTTGLEYVDQLHKLLDEWDNNNLNDFAKFEEFFDKHSPKIDLLDIISAKSPKSSNLPKLDTQTGQFSLIEKHHSHHFLLKITELLRSLGPLVFKVWRSALLRERILLFDAPSVELNCAYAYCLSVLSTIPQEIHWLLNESGCWATQALQFIQPVYSIGVNDIDWLKSLVDPSLGNNSNTNKKSSFIASTTDEILLFKNTLYDISVRLNQPHHINNSTIPKIFLSDASLPGSLNTDPLKATQRDLKRFRILSKEFGLNDHINQNETLSTQEARVKTSDSNDLPVDESTVINDEEIIPEILPWWTEVSEPTSWRQLAWSGFYWWASAGEKEKIEEEQELEGLNELNESNKQNEIEQSLILVGYFQNMTKRVFTTIADIINNENESNDDADELVDKTIWIEPADVFEMGLDPYSKQDAEFVVKLIQLWWNRKAQVGSRLTNLCCF